VEITKALVVVVDELLAIPAEVAAALPASPPQQLLA
jgi:hypothetical protein